MWSRPQLVNRVIADPVINVWRTINVTIGKALSVHTRYSELIDFIFGL